MHETENEDINNNYFSDDNDDINIFSGLSSSDEEVYTHCSSFDAFLILHF